MPNVTVFNLHTDPITVSGGYYTDLIPVNGNVTFEVVDTDEFVKLPANVALVESGHIRIELEDDSSDLRPFEVHATFAGLPAAGNYPEGYPIVAIDGGVTGTDYLYVQVGGAWVVACTNP